MRYLLSLVVCGILALSAQAHFLFLRIPPPEKGDRVTEVFFSDRPDTGDATFIDKIAHTKLWAQSEPGKFQPLKTEKAEDRLRAVLPKSETVSVIGDCVYGVLERPKAKSFLLRHYPKTISGDLKTLQTMEAKKEIPFEMLFKVEGEHLHFWTRHEKNGQPEEFVVLGTSPTSTKLKAKDGKVSWKPEPGSYVVYTYLFRNQAGMAGEKKYEQIREFCTLAFRWPLGK